MTTPERINPWRQLAILKGRDALLAVLDHVYANAGAADVLTCALGYDDAHWAEVERRAGRGPVASIRVAVVDALRERASAERRAARMDPDAAADAAGADRHG